MIRSGERQHDMTVVLPGHRGKQANSGKYAEVAASPEPAQLVPVSSFLHLSFVPAAINLVTPVVQDASSDVCAKFLSTAYLHLQPDNVNSFHSGHLKGSNKI